MHRIKNPPTTHPYVLLGAAETGVAPIAFEPDEHVKHAEALDIDVAAGRRHRQLHRLVVQNGALQRVGNVNTRWPISAIG